MIANVLVHTIEPCWLTPEQYEKSTRYEHQYARIIFEDFGLPVVHYYLTEGREVIRHRHMWGYPMVGCPASFLTRLPRSLWAGHPFHRSLSLAMLRELRKESELEALHIHAYHLLQHDLMALYFRDKIIISHDHGDPGYVSWLRLLRLFKPFVLKNFSDAVIVQSSWEMNRLLLRGVSVEKMALIFPGADREIFRKIDKAEARRKLGLRAEAFYVIFVGSLLHRKGVDVLLKAWKLVLERKPHPRLHLLLAGQGRQEAEYRALAGKLSLNESVSFVGFVGHDSLPFYLNAADLFVAPSRAEPLGKMNIEAMMCGLPVISTDDGGTPDIIESGETGLLVPSGDVESLAEAMLTLIGDEAQRACLAWKAYLRAQANYGWDKSASKLRKVYERLGLLRPSEN
ncbi:MAG: glycosyltransferase family 4 protein [Anaerolineae bacterium]